MAKKDTAFAAALAEALTVVLAAQAQGKGKAKGKDQAPVASDFRVPPGTYALVSDGKKSRGGKIMPEARVNGEYLGRAYIGVGQTATLTVK